ncbi:MAG: trehalose-6-phosphate synthase, partial [Thermoanaerobaculia bacterium]
RRGGRIPRRVGRARRSRARGGAAPHGERSAPVSRLVVVSNRIPVGRPSALGGELELPAGGLVSALLGALEKRSDSVWIGWDSRAPAGARPTQIAAHGVTLVGLPLERAEVEGYYDGFCNQALWPLLHCFPGRVVFEPRHVAAYFAVQERFADAVAARVRPGDAVWVHDYHLFGLARALRARGVTAPLGFFLHTPFPPDDVWSILPRARRLLGALLDYDLIGFHTRHYLENYIQACRRELGAEWRDGRLAAGEQRQRVGVYPVGIEPADFEPSASLLRRKAMPGRLAKMARGRRVVLGVDRLDYTKGLPERFRAFELFLRARPDWHDRVSLVQIASPSRADLPEYERERRDLERIVGRINGEFGRVDWVPLRYVHRSHPRDELARFYREADVALVTPLRDGMNLVAKEFVAAQRPERPGALVLSRFAGAAETLTEAIRVNPYVPAECAEALAEALEMPIEERLRRHAALLATVRAETASKWATDFVAALAG